MAEKLRVDIVSDVVCPWCIVGYKQVEKALATFDPPLDVEFHWHPFELNPDMGPEGQDVGEHIAQKYGSTPEQSRANQQRLSDIGDSVGFAFTLAPGRRIYNTFDAHKLLGATGRDFGWQRQTELKLALFKAYFQDNRDVSDRATLLEISDSVGLDRHSCAAWLDDDMLSAQVRGEERYWRGENINGVPAIIFDQKFLVPGAQSAETFANIVSRILAQRTEAAIVG